VSASQPKVYRIPARSASNFMFDASDGIVLTCRNWC
jgi:hypothetical protein